MTSALQHIQEQEKTAILPLIASQGLGYGVGRVVGRDMGERGEKKPPVGAGTIAGALLLPGGAGYVIGKRHGIDAVEREKAEAKQAKKQQKKASLAKEAAISDWFKKKGPVTRADAQQTLKNVRRIRERGKNIVGSKIPTPILKVKHGLEDAAYYHPVASGLALGTAGALTARAVKKNREAKAQQKAASFAEVIYG